MVTLSVDLACRTDPKWVEVVLKRFDEFLADHADCERKASAMAMQFVAKCPDRTEILEPLIELAIEELTHFKQVYALMRKRGIALKGEMTKDLYVNQLMSLCRTAREERLLDRLIVASIIERRGSERFGMIADALEDPGLKSFYRKLYAAEVKHGTIFVRLASLIFDQDCVGGRLTELLQEEGRIVKRLAWRPSLH